MKGRGFGFSFRIVPVLGPGWSRIGVNRSLFQGVPPLEMGGLYDKITSKQTNSGPNHANMAPLRGAGNGLSQ